MMRCDKYKTAMDNAPPCKSAVYFTNNFQFPHILQCHGIKPSNFARNIEYCVCVCVGGGGGGAIQALVYTLLDESYQLLSVPGCHLLSE